VSYNNSHKITGFWYESSTTDQLFCICQILEKKRECRQYNSCLQTSTKHMTQEGCTVQYSSWLWYTNKVVNSNQNVFKQNLQ